MNKLKYPLLSVASIVLCGIIGFGWAKLMVLFIDPLWEFIAEIKGVNDDRHIIEYLIPILLLLTFAAVSVIYSFAEKFCAEYGFTKGEFFVWFVVIPFAVNLIPSFAMVSILTSSVISTIIFSALVLESVAYFLIMIFCTIRLIIRKIYLMFKKGDLNGNNS